MGQGFSHQKGRVDLNGALKKQIFSISLDGRGASEAGREQGRGGGFHCRPILNGAKCPSEQRALKNVRVRVNDCNLCASYF